MVLWLKMWFRVKRGRDFFIFWKMFCNVFLQSPIPKLGGSRRVKSAPSSRATHPLATSPLFTSIKPSFPLRRGVVHALLSSRNRPNRPRNVISPILFFTASPWRLLFFCFHSPPTNVRRDYRRFLKGKRKLWDRARSERVERVWSNSDIKLTTRE